MICRKYCWIIRRYNSSHTCTRAIISQDHSKLDSNIITEVIKLLVKVDPSIKVKSIIAEVQSKFNYTISYHKAWLAKQELVEKFFGGWKASYETLPIWFEAIVKLLEKIQDTILKKLIVNIGYSRTVRKYDMALSAFTRTGQNEVFEVREMSSGVEYIVNLRRQCYGCGEFQVDQIPCRHLDWQLYVHDVYKIDQVQRVYRARFRLLGNFTTRSAYHGPQFIPNPFLKRVTKGQPKMTRFLNEMDT
ncbi:hypothetical protein Ahy_A05g025113 [Arachis hypogaea]|uniref:SWIM-type domain-containing protein n=1 Tax=Arachis hypogaea TaxID=3818 RepID=A0A445D7L7_ARAHY|nr:hypothetical protein Ahy_A05g025113 [Arachis hypogaea]